MKKIIIPGITLAVFMLMMDALKFTHHFPTDEMTVILLTIVSGFTSIFLIMLWIKKKYYFNPSLSIKLSFFDFETASFSPLSSTRYPPSVLKRWVT